MSVVSDSGLTEGEIVPFGRSITPRDAQPVVALRDASVIIVAYCVRSGPVRPALPSLVAGSTVLESFGGVEAHVDGSVWFDYAYYPPVTRRDFTVGLGDNAIARVHFPHQPRGDCHLQADRLLHVVGCGYLVRVRWPTALSLSSSRAGPLSVDVRQIHPQRTDLGFYFEGVRDGERGLIVEFAFRAPESNASDISIRLRDVFERMGTADVTYPLKASLSRRFKVRLS